MNKQCVTHRNFPPLRTSEVVGVVGNLLGQSNHKAPPLRKSPEKIYGPVSLGHFLWPFGTYEHPVIVILTFQWPAPMRCLKFLADEWEALFVSEEDALVSRCLCGRAPMETERDRNLVGRSEGQILISSGDLFCSCGENAIKLGPTT